MRLFSREAPAAQRKLGGLPALISWTLGLLHRPQPCRTVVGAVMLAVLCGCRSDTEHRFDSPPESRMVACQTGQYGSRQIPASSQSRCPGLAPRPSLLSVKNPADRSLLETRSRPLDRRDGSCLKPLLDAMRASIVAHKGMGLAAVQLGVPVRVIMLRVPDEQHRIAEAALINPVVVTRSTQKAQSFELCLSVPGGYRMTERANQLRVSYTDPEGKPRESVYRGDAAIVIQQELDHLDGILLDRDLPAKAFLDEQGVQRFELAARELTENRPHLAIAEARRMLWKAHLARVWP